MTDYDKASVETIRGALRAYCSDDMVRVAVLKRLADAILLVDHQAPYQQRCWTVTFPRKKSKVIRLLVSKASAVPLRVLDLCYHEKTGAAIVRFLIQIDDRKRSMLQEALATYKGTVNRTTYGRDQLEVGPFIPCIVDLPSAHAARDEVFELFKNEFYSVIQHEAYAKHELKERMWGAYQPNIITYLRNELAPLDIPEPDDELAPMPMERMIGLLDPVHTPDASNGQEVPNATSGLDVANKGGFDTGRDREIPPDIEFPILPGEDAKCVSYQVDEAKQRRATAVHQGILVHVRRWLSMYTDTVKENTAADTICLIGDTAHIFEFKGITEGTELDQYRNTVAKLYEYRYRMASKDRRYTDAYLWMVLSGPLHRPWIVDYLTGDRQIGVLWIEGKAVGGPSLAAFERIARAVTPAPSKP